VNAELPESFLDDPNAEVASNGADDSNEPVSLIVWDELKTGLSFSASVDFGAEVFSKYFEMLISELPLIGADLVSFELA